MEKIDESPSARKSGSVTASPVPGSKSSGQTVTTAQAQTRVKSSTFTVQLQGNYKLVRKGSFDCKSIWF